MVAAKMARNLGRRPFTVLVEGNIGAGKTSFLNRFQRLPATQILQEPVDKWRNVNGTNLLHLMYEDPVRWCMVFQTYVQLTMLDMHTTSNGEPIKLMERSIHSARFCFIENLKNAGKMVDSEYKVLGAWYDYLNSCPRMDLSADLVVYLRTDPEVAFERLKNRNRGEENLISLQYIQDLHKLHESWLLQRRHPLPGPVLVLDANKNCAEMESDFLSLKDFLQRGALENLQLKGKL